MAAAGKHRVLIDGFPRNADNKETFIRMVSVYRRQTPWMENSSGIEEPS